MFYLKKQLPTLLLFCGYLFSKSIFACDTSKDIDLRNKFCKQRNQDTIGWCYAFAASDLLTFQIHKDKGTKNCDHTVSAIHTANLYNKSDPEQRQAFKNALQNLSDEQPVAEVVPEGGFAYDAMKLLYKNGYCLESEISSQDFKWPENFQGGQENLRKIFYSIYKNKFEEQPFCAVENQLNALFPKLFLSQIQDIYENYSAENLMTKLEKAACANPQIPSRRSVVRYDRTKNDKDLWFRDEYNVGKNPSESTTTSRSKIEKVIDTVLANESPVAISIPYTLLSNVEGMHALNIVGKKMNCETGEYEYILRNSEGDSCDSFLNITIEISNQIYEARNRVYTKEEIQTQGISSPDLISVDTIEEKLKKQHELHNEVLKNAKPYNPHLRCEKGYIFLPAKVLTPKLNSITFIK